MEGEPNEARSASWLTLIVKCALLPSLFYVVMFVTGMWLEFGGIYYCFVYQGVGYGAASIFIPPYAFYKSLEFAYRLAAGTLPSTEDKQQSRSVRTKWPDKAGIDKQLREAAGRGDFAQVKSLLDKGADVNAQDKYGETALMLAAYYGRMDVLKLALHKGADIRTKERGGGTALMMASSKGYVEVVKLLLESGSDVNARDKNGLAALMYASSKGHGDVVGLVLLTDRLYSNCAVAGVGPEHTPHTITED